MKLKIFYTILSCSIVQFSCDYINDTDPSGSAYPPLPAFDVQWNDQNTLICFGTSLTYGYGAGAKKPEGFIGAGGNPNRINVGDSSYPRFLQEKLKINVLNKGYVGERIGYALSILDDSIIVQKPALVLLEFGANDFLWDIPASVADSLLSVLVTRIQNHGTKVVLLSFIHPDMLHYASTGRWTSQDSILALEYNAMFNTVAKRFALPLIDYPLAGVFGHPEMMSDRLHPNGTGYMRMEKNIYFALIHSFIKNGMLN